MYIQPSAQNVTNLISSCSWSELHGAQQLSVCLGIGHFVFGECNLFFKDFLIGTILTNNPQGLIWVIFVMDTNIQGLVSELPSKNYENCFVAA